MLRRSLSRATFEAITSAGEAYLRPYAPHFHGRVLNPGATARLPRGISTASAESADIDDDEETIVNVPITTKPNWAPGTPPPGREQRVGEAWAAMQHHGRGTRKIKKHALHLLLLKISTKDELKYADLALELFRKKEIPITAKTATLYIQACCRAGAPEAAVETLSKAEMGLAEHGLVTPDKFNFLLTQLYKAGDDEGLRRAVDDAISRGQTMDNRSRAVIGKIDAAEKAAALAKAEEERLIAEKAAAEKAAEEKAAAEKAAAENAAAEEPVAAGEVAMDAHGEATSMQELEARSGSEEECVPPVEGAGANGTAGSDAEKTVEGDGAPSGSGSGEGR